MTAKQTRSHGTRVRAPAWGADLPQTDAQARERLVEAAEACFVEGGPSVTTMTDIAAKASVHRTTLYSFFPNRDAILAACFVKATNDVVVAADPYFRGEGPFIDRLVDGLVAGLATARLSPLMRSMVAPDEMARTHHVAEQSEAFRVEIVDQFARWFADAPAGEVRTDISPRMLAYWVTRVCFSLMEEPGSPEFGGDEGLLRTFLPGMILPQPTA